MKESYIRKLISILENSKLQTLELSSFWGMNKILLSKNIHSNNKINEDNSRQYNTKPTPIENSKDGTLTLDITPIQTEDSDDPVDIKDTKKTHSITAPLVGTFYQSSKPGDSPFIKVGDTIKVGQTICIIEAMKIFNEIESDIDGIVMNVCVEDSSPVEYGQVLFDIQIND